MVNVRIGVCFTVSCIIFFTGEFETVDFYVASRCLLCYLIHDMVLLVRAHICHCFTVSCLVSHRET